MCVGSARPPLWAWLVGGCTQALLEMIALERREKQVEIGGLGTCTVNITDDS